MEGCQTAARLKGRFQLASISLAVRHISPLAVLQSIYEPDELHFYVERATDDEAVAGAEAVVEARFTGPTRFAEVKAFAQELLENTIAIGDLDAAFTGPHFLPPLASTTPSQMGVPSRRRLFLCHAGRCPDRMDAMERWQTFVWTPIAILSNWSNVSGAYEKFAAFEYPDEELAEVSTMPATQVERREVSVDQFKQAVSTALDQIEAKAYEKVVLARSIELHADQDWQPLDALNRLRERFGGCFTFSFGGGQGRSFIGATPERLIKVRNGQLATDAIAGSAPRGATAREDAKFARELLESAKDLHEHACVRESILRRLESCGVSACAEAQPRLLPLPNVQHLRTRITAPASESVHLMDLVAELHPTPAVGGTPRAAAVSHIRELEKLDRGLFAGAIGWFDHRNEGEMIVGIRSALIDGAVARLYAGAGIVKGSDPRKELNETEIKLGAMLNALT